MTRRAAMSRPASLSRRRRFAALVALGLAVTTGCTTESRLTAGGTAPEKTTTVTVLAAASLTEPLTTLARQYERTHAGVKVALSV